MYKGSTAVPSDSTYLLQCNYFHSEEISVNIIHNNVSLKYFVNQLHFGGSVSSDPRTWWFDLERNLPGVRVGGSGGIRLKVGFQPLMVISPTAVVHAGVCGCRGELIKPSTQFRHRYESLILYWPNGRAKRFPNSLMPSAKPRSANLPVTGCRGWDRSTPCGPYHHYLRGGGWEWESKTLAQWQQVQQPEGDLDVEVN